MTAVLPRASQPNIKERGEKEPSQIGVNFNDAVAQWADQANVASWRAARLAFVKAANMVPDELSFLFGLEASSNRSKSAVDLSGPLAIAVRNRTKAHGAWELCVLTFRSRWHAGDVVAYGFPVHAPSADRRERIPNALADIATFTTEPRVEGGAGSHADAAGRRYRDVLFYAASPLPQARGRPPQHDWGEDFIAAARDYRKKSPDATRARVADELLAMPYWPPQPPERDTVRKKVSKIWSETTPVRVGIK